MWEPDIPKHGSITIEVPDGPLARRADGRITPLFRCFVHIYDKKNDELVPHEISYEVANYIDWGATSLAISLSRWPDMAKELLEREAT